MTSLHRVCNLCGSVFNEWDIQQDIGIHKQICYGSKHDTEYINLDLCCDCFDKVMDELNKRCGYHMFDDYNTNAVDEIWG